MLLNSFLKSVQPPPILEFVNRCHELITGQAEIINLGQGTAFFRPPDEALERLNWSRVHGYVDDQGLPELREKIASDYHPDSDVLLTPGANNAFFTLLVTVLNRDDEVILPSPVYFNHSMAVEMLGGRTVEVPCDNSFELDIEAIRNSITEKTRIITIISPNNPTGAVYDRKMLEEVTQICLERDIMLISDETYTHFVFDGKKHQSAYEIARDAGVNAACVSSFSKIYGIPGWRLGYLVTPSMALIDELLKVQDTLNICAPVPAQYLALELLENWQEYFREKIAGIAERKRAIERSLGKYLHYRPGGAFYCFPRFASKSYEQALELAVEKRVIVLPGSMFGRAGEDHVRLAYGALPPEELEKAGKLVVEFLDEREGL